MGKFWGKICIFPKLFSKIVMIFPNARGAFCVYYTVYVGLANYITKQNNKQGPFNILCGPFYM